MIYIIFGTTCSGKTTHGERLAKRLGYWYFSSGHVARKLMDVETATLFKSGQLSPHENLIRMALNNDVTASDGRIVIDGFPRLYTQWDWFGKTFGYANTYGIFLDVPLWLAARRGTLRQRDDYDEEVAFSNRHILFLQETKRVIDEIQRLGMLYTVKMSEEMPVEYYDWKIWEAIGGKNFV